MSASSSTNRRRNARLLTAGAIVAGLAGSAAVVWHASYSAFSAQTTSPSSNWSAGTVSLSDDDSNTALFNWPATQEHQKPRHEQPGVDPHG